MSDEVTIVACGQCKRVLDELSNTPEYKREPCPNCGSVSRLVKKEIADSISVRDGVRGKARSGEAGKPGGKPWSTTMSEPSWSYSAQKWMHREKTENRRENRYTEVVKDPETGEIVHEVEVRKRGNGKAPESPALLRLCIVVDTPRRP